MTMKKLKENKWVSRKLVITVIGALIVTLNDAIGLGLDQDTVWQLATVLTGYVIGQGVADAKKKKTTQE